MTELVAEKVARLRRKFIPVWPANNAFPIGYNDGLAGREARIWDGTSGEKDAYWRGYTDGCNRKDLLDEVARNPGMPAYRRKELIGE